MPKLLVSWYPLPLHAGTLLWVPTRVSLSVYKDTLFYKVYDATDFILFIFYIVHSQTLSKSHLMFCVLYALKKTHHTLT